MAEEETSVKNTTAIGLGVGGGTALLVYLCSPVWPPPDSVLALVVGASAPIAHLVYKGVYKMVAKWAGEDGNGNPPPTPAPPLDQLPVSPVAPGVPHE